MKAYQIVEFGLEGLRMQNVPVPAPGYGQVLVAVKAASLNYRDLLMAKGHYDKNMPLPLIPLSDGAGEVVALGPGVTKLKVGDRVAGAFFQSWIDGPYSRDKSRLPLGGPLPGMLAEKVVLEEAAAVVLPDSLSFEQGAALPCAGVTAWNALFEGPAPVRPGETVLVQGTGGVSMFALQFACAAGARVIATSSSDEKLERAKALGARATINYRATPEWGAAVRKLCGGVDCVVEVGGAGTMKQSLDAIRYGGRVEVIGVLSGVVGELATTTILHKCANIRGIYVGSVEMFRSMLRAIEANGIEPVVGVTFEFDEVLEAFKLLEGAGHFGKVVIRL